MAGDVGHLPGRMPEVLEKGPGNDRELLARGVGDVPVAWKDISFNYESTDTADFVFTATASV